MKSQYFVRKKNIFDPASTVPYPMSRSKFEDFLNCPRCFYMDRRLGVAKPDMPSFQLNKAVDELLKREFDSYRGRREPHPIMTKHGINAIPFSHQDLEIWRDNFKGLQYHHRETNFMVSGAIDDVWQDKEGRLIVLDYKATWTERAASLDDEWKQSWKRQLEIYQWLLQGMGFEVSKTGYFVFCNVDTSEGLFNQRLCFKIELWPYDADHSWVEPKLFEARQCLGSDQIPPPDPGCHFCAYKKASATLAAQRGVLRD